MSKLTLDDASTGHNAQATLLLNEMRNLREQPILRTYLHTQGVTCVFATTNDKVHLSLGKLTLLGQFGFYKILEDHFKTHTQSLLVLGVSPREGTEDRSNVLLVTRTEDPVDGTIYHLSPAR